MIITVRFCERGFVVNEFNHKEREESFLEYYRSQLEADEDGETAYCTEDGIMMVRILILRGDADHKHIVFKFNDGTKDHEIFPNEYGQIADLPNGFCDLSITYCEELILEASKKMRKS